MTSSPSDDEPTGIYPFPIRSRAELLGDALDRVITRRTWLASLRPPTGALDALTRGIAARAAERQGKPDAPPRDVRSALGLPPALPWPEYVHACRVMPTRPCPVSYADVCGPRPCARFESSDESPWEHELRTGEQPRHRPGCECIGCAS